jgi:hypothetical protein
VSAVSQIVTELKEEIKKILPDFRESPFTYNLEDNDSQLDKAFGVKIGSASVTSGVTRHVTFNQDIQIDVSRKYFNKKDSGDSDLRSKIEMIHGDIEKLYKTLSLRALSVPNATVLLISPLDISAPTQDDYIVTLTLTLNVQYRVSIK